MIVEWSLTAEIDIQRIADDLDRKNPRTGLPMLQRIYDGFERLSASPYLVRAGRIDGTRELVIADTPYVVIYMLSDRFIFIFRVLHGAQYWPDSRTWQNED